MILMVKNIVSVLEHQENLEDSLCTVENDLDHLKSDVSLLEDRENLKNWLSTVERKISKGSGKIK